MPLSRDEDIVLDDVHRGPRLDPGLLDEDCDVDAELGDEARDDAPHEQVKHDQVVDEVLRTPGHSLDQLGKKSKYKVIFLKLNVRLALCAVPAGRRSWRSGRSGRGRGGRGRVQSFRSCSS